MAVDIIRRMGGSLLLTLAVTFCILPGAPSAAWAQPAIERPAQVGPPSEIIRGQYIVVFSDRVDNPQAEAARMLRGTGGELLHSYEHALRGFAARIPDAAYQGIRMNPNVAFVEPDVSVAAGSMTQTNATWGIDRIDQRSRPLDGRYAYQQTGAGVYAYIVDTGIRSTHMEFAGRTAPGASAINDGPRHGGHAGQQRISAGFHLGRG
jgi:subtilisin family serine protease